MTQLARRRGLLLLLLALLAPSGFLLPAHATSSQQRTSTSGQVAVVRYIYHGFAVQPPHAAVRTVKLRDPVYDQYTLLTRQNEKASVRFGDSTTLHLNQETQAILRSPHETYVTRGEVQEYLAPGTVHRIRAAAGVAASVGTAYDVKIVGRQATFVVLHGARHVSNPRGSVIVKNNQATRMSPNQAPSQPTPVDAKAVFAWADQIPVPDIGEDVALDSNGGSIVGSSSQRGGRWSVHRINDGLTSAGWESAPGKTTNQWVRIGFSPERLYRIGAVIIDPGATGGDPASMDLKDFQLKVSSTGSKATDFTLVYTGTLRQEHRLQEIRLPTPVLARYVELVARTNYGSRRGVAVAEFEVVAETAGLNSPEGIAVDRAGNLYVADTGNDRIVKLSADGKLLAAWGTKGRRPGQFLIPFALAVDSQGNLYVGDSRGIQKLSPSGRPLAQWRGVGGPRIAIDAQDNLYVVKLRIGGKHFQNWIQKYSSTGQMLMQWRVKEGISDIAVDVGDHVYAVVSKDEPNATTAVWKFSPEGKRLAVYKVRPGRQAPGMIGPPRFYLGGIAVDARGNVYVVDTYFLGRVVEYSPSGQQLSSWSVPAFPEGPIQAPMAIDRQGDIYVLYSMHSRIAKVSATGKLLDQWGVLGTIPQVLGEPTAVALDRHGNIYVTDVTNGRIQVRSSAGNVIATYGRKELVFSGSGPIAGGPPPPKAGQFASPVSIAVDSRGVMYVADSATGRVQQLSDRGPLGFVHGIRGPYVVAVDHRDRLDVIYTSCCIVSGHRVNGNTLEERSPSGRPLAWRGIGMVRYPGAVAVDPSSNIYVADPLGDTIWKFSPRLKLLSHWGTRGRRPGQFMFPSGLAIGPGGNIFVADVGNHRIQKLSPKGQPLAIWRMADTVSLGPIAVGPRGSIYVIDSLNQRIQKLSPTGKVLAIWE